MKEKVEVTNCVPYKMDKSEHLIRVVAVSEDFPGERVVVISNSQSFMPSWVRIPIKEWAKVKDAVDRAIIRLEEIEGR